MNKYKLLCPCHFGLESVLAGEIKRMGGENVLVNDGKVYFEGDENMIARANIGLRTAERVLIVLSEFEATTFEELYQGVLAINLEDYISKDDAFPVKGWSLNSKLYSIPDCQSIIKKAAVDRLKKCYGISWFVETKSLYQIQFSIHKDIVTIMIDTSGVGLHKRGYRIKANDAPIKETLAAGIIDLARVKDYSKVVDPLCGSGTFLIESTTKALNIAPGIKRTFAFENWSIIDKNISKNERQRALDLIKRNTEYEAVGYDIDSESIEIARQNIARSGTSSKIKVNRRDIKDFKSDFEKAIVFCNPPYGERMLELKQAEDIYKTMGDIFQKDANNSYYIISPHEQFERIYGKRADKRRKLYNGMLKCQLFMYFK